VPEGTITTLECPRDADTLLVAVDRNGVTVDACPRCRGIWLDRGELDKLIDLESAGSDDFTDEIRGTSRETESDDHSGKHSSDHGSGRSSTKRRKRGSFLGDLLDFG
jgi:Zn-finger nucleic acid-binding protein